MSKPAMLTAGTTVRIIRPRWGENQTAFRRRMETMAAVLTEHCSDTLAVFLLEPPDSSLACVVAHTPASALVRTRT